MSQSAQPHAADDHLRGGAARVGGVRAAARRHRERPGKGGKDRYTVLSLQLLAELRAYWRACRPR